MAQIEMDYHYRGPINSEKDWHRGEIHEVDEAIAVALCDERKYAHRRTVADQLTGEKPAAAATKQLEEPAKTPAAEASEVTADLMTTRRRHK